ncbi:MAG: hypothetical protein KAR07_06585 [Spirochaetes bacterium]|nr:hypothetical protein [Spirochaetota bacterium]
MKKIKFDDITLSDYDEIVGLYNKETPRAVVILASSYVEYFLGKYLKSFMVKDIREKELFEGFGPFSSFAQRIEASYAFGIITKEEKNDLLIIKKIRNFFAHYPKKISFRNHEFKKLCSTLSRSKSKMPTKKGWRTDTSRVTFLITVGIFVCNANGRMLKNMKHNKSLQAIGTRRQMASNSSP